MESKKVLKYKDYKIKEKYNNYVIANAKGSLEDERLNKKDFLDFDDVNVGDTWRLYYNSKNNNYCYLANLFSQDYYQEKFKYDIGKISTGIFKLKIGANYIIKIGKDKYIRLGEYNLINSLTVGEEVSFLVEKNYRLGRLNFDINKANLKKFCEELEAQNIKKIKLKIKKMIDKDNGVELLTYSQEKKLDLKLYLKKDIEDKFFGLSNNRYYLERNVELLNKYILTDELELYFNFDLNMYRNRRKMFFSLDIQENYRELLSENDCEIAKLHFDFNDYNFYLEREDIGTCKLNTFEYSLVELKLLESLNQKNVLIEMEKNKNKKSKKIRLLPVLFDCEDEIENLVIVDRTKIFSDRIIYQLAFIDKKDNNCNYRMFIDGENLSYTDKIFEVGEKIDKLKLKYNVKNLFNFYTRLPYIENPLLTILKDKKEGDTIIARIEKIEKNYIEVLLDGRYRKIILQRDLKNLSDFEISDYYKVGQLSEFYIYDISENDVRLLGYNLEKIRDIFDTIKCLDENNKGDNLECKVLPCIGGYKGVYECNGEVLEVKIPENELSYIDIDLNFKPDIKYQFKVIGKGLQNNKYGLLLSRKRISKNMKNELKSRYPIGSKINAIYFTSDENGMFFNLTDSNYISTFGDLIGYLPYNKIELYPNINELKKNIFSKYYSEFKIKKYPKKFNSLCIKEKAIELDVLNKFKTLEEIVGELDRNNIEIDLKNINTKNLIIKDNNKNYYETVLTGETIVLSMDKDESFEKIEKLYLNFRNRKDENEIYRELYSNFKNVNLFKTSLKRIESKNNTIEVSLNKKIKEILEKREIVFSQNIGDKYLFGDKELGYLIKIDEENDIPKGNYKCKIKEIVNNICILEIEVNTKLLINKEVKVKILGKELENLYKAQLGNNTILFVQSVYELYENERVYCKINSIEEDRIFAEISIKEELVKNCASYINKKIEENIENIDIEVLKDLILENSEKSKFIKLILGIEKKILSGEKIGRYIIDKIEFSNGAFGKVYEGFDLLTRKKVIQKRYCADKSLEEYISFKNEAKILKELEIDEVMKVYWSNEDIYIGEFIEGKTYAEYLKESKTFGEKIEVCIKIAEALDKIHQLNIYHLDIKPENILIESKGNVKLIDFGCSQNKYEKYGKYGTLNYSSPLQCLGYINNEKIEFTAQDDIYSFGILLYETFVGELPYDEKILGEDGIIQAHLKGRITTENVEYKYISPREKNLEIPERLEKIINKCLDKIENRYEEVIDILDNLDEILEEENGNF